MLNFTVGPVQSSDEVRRLGGEQVPYFRTYEFSNTMIENEKLIKKFAKAQDDSKVVFLTSSGTGAMEATIMNVLTKKDNAIVINGGSFGQRFVDICKVHEIPTAEIKLALGENISQELLNKYDNKNYTALLVNAHETSTGVLYNLKLISNFCKKNDILLIVDAISAFLADPINFTELGIDVLITSSQKALACPPGISLLVLSKRALNIIENADVKSYYFNLKDALKNAERGQTPFTPAVSILLQINARLKEIERNGGVETEIAKVKCLAEYFREQVKDMPLKFVTNDMSNAVTALIPLNVSAYQIFTKIKERFGIWICPNGGNFKDKIFRVGHIGNLTKDDYNKLISAMKKLIANNEM